MIEFAPLFTLDVAHTYYDGRCLDFEFVVVAATARQLAGAHLLARTREARLHVLFENGAPRLDGHTLRFGLRLRNSRFANFTALPPRTSGSLALYRNTGAPTDLHGPDELLLNPAHAEDGALLRENLFGLVEIEVGSSFYGAPPAFTVAFAAREETLRYYVVARNYGQTEFGQLDVNDTGFAAEGRPRILFDRIPPSGFAAGELPPSLLAPGNARLALFRSRTPVARRARGRKRIELSRNQSPVIENLPQPGAAAATADLIIHLSK